MSVPQKHHYVPQFLLRRFADSQKKLLVHPTDRDEPPRWSPVRKTAQTLGGHTLHWPGREPDHVGLENAMGSIETETGKVVAALLAGNARTPSEDDREVLGFFLALQWYRSRFTLDLLERSVIDPDEPVDELARSIAIRQILPNVIWPWFARREGEFDPKERFCYIADWLMSHHWAWRLYRPAGPKLIVGDNIVCMWGTAAGETSQMPEAWTHDGVGVGFNNCARVTVPLTPDLGLVIHRTNRPDLRTMTAVTFNRATIFNSREFVAHHPEGLPDPALRRALLEDLWTQRQLLPIIQASTRSAAEEDAREAARRRRELPYSEPF